MIDQAVEILRRGGTVVFPTETVYGLGADATNAVAVRRVFAIKGRPSTNPCIVHVADIEIARKFAAHWPELATKLVENFWPGPLTIVLRKNPSIVDEATAGKNTVGLRAPDHPLTLQLLQQFGGAVVGPSANRSTHVSPTTAEHVREELGDAVDLILDGGECKVGIESTVLDLSAEHPVIFRPGMISRAQIEAIVGPVSARNMVTEVTMPASAPGQHAVHYAPISPTYRFERGQENLIEQWKSNNPGRAMIVLNIGTTSPRDYARRMYATLRHADRQSPAAIWVEMPPDELEWTAVRDRLLRASRQPAARPT